jgi:ATP-binding cassette, subfamily B, bacterial PglK
MSLVTDVRRIHAILEPKEKRRFFFVLIVMAIAAGLQVVSVAAIYPFLAVIADPDVVKSGLLGAVYSWFGFATVERFLVMLSLLLFTLLIMANGALIFEKWVMERFKYSIGHTLSVRLIRTYLAREYSFFLNRNTSELQKNVLKEANKVATNLVDASLKLISKGLVAVGLVILLLVADPMAVLIIVGVIGGGFVLIYQLIRRRITHLGRRNVRFNKRRFRIAQESFSGAKEVKVLGRENALVERFVPASRKWSKGQANYHVLKEIPKPIIEVLAVGGLLIVLAILLVTGQPVAAIIPMMGLFVFAGYRFMPVFKDVTAALVSFRFNEAVLDLVEGDLNDGRQGLKDSEQKVERLPFKEVVQLENVSYRYPQADRAALDTVNIEIPKDASVAFVGETGAGKTTLVDLILGFYEPESGRMLVDRKEVTPANVRGWQQNVGYVPQEIFLTDDTIRRNIAFALRDAEIDEAAVVRAAKIAHIHDFIVNELPEGYDTVIGERGVRLSGGQRQRLGIARALYHDPDVIVLDEATSDIDNVTEANITAAIEDLAGVKTLIIIAHRLSTIRNCDRIYVLDHGKIVGEGTYEELVARNKPFMALAQTHTVPI